MDHAPTGARRTQEQRSAATQARIIAGALRCLQEVGYAGMSTPEICRRAGLSRGALLHHFPTKTQLTARLLQTLSEQHKPALQRVAIRSDTQQSSVAPLLDLMWAAFEGPAFHVVLELWTAARGDSELQAVLHAAERRDYRDLRRLFQRLPTNPVSQLEESAREHFENLLALTLHLLRGMAQPRVPQVGEHNPGELFALWKDIVARELQMLPPPSKQQAGGALDPLVEMP